MEEWVPHNETLWGMCDSFMRQWIHGMDVSAVYFGHEGHMWKAKIRQKRSIQGGTKTESIVIKVPYGAIEKKLSGINDRTTPDRESLSSGEYMAFRTLIDRVAQSLTDKQLLTKGTHARTYAQTNSILATHVLGFFFCVLFDRSFNTVSRRVFCRVARQDLMHSGTEEKIDPSIPHAR